jgi:DNA-binding response OmpR family regulator
MAAKILQIDHDADVLRFVRRALEAEGHTVRASRDAAEGLRLAAADEPDLVLLDLAMPGLSGQAVMAALLADAPHRKIMILSDHADVTTRVRCLDGGAMDVLGKPFDMAELLARVRVQLRIPALQAGSRHTEELICGALRLNLRTRRLATPIREVELPQREFALLEHLMRHPGTICSRAELLSEVWGYVFDPGSNVVDVTIARLRGKMTGASIETVRNVGYRLVPDAARPTAATVIAPRSSAAGVR